MGRKFTARVLNDYQIETVLERLYHQSDRQISSLLLHYLPQLPNLSLFCQSGKTQAISKF